MAGDPAILKRTRACPFARGGRVLVRFRANGHSLFARRSGEPLARLRLTGNGDRVVLLYPSHRGGWGALGDFGASATPLDDALQCLSDNPYFLELRQTYGRAASAYRYAERRPFPETTDLVPCLLYELSGTSCGLRRFLAFFVFAVNEQNSGEAKQHH